jgi:hypothetical protein
VAVVVRKEMKRKTMTWTNTKLHAFELSLLPNSSFAVVTLSYGAFFYLNFDFQADGYFAFSEKVSW